MQGLFAQAEVQGNSAIRFEQLIGRDVVGTIALLAGEHPHVLIREHQLEVELGDQPCDSSAAEPPRYIVLTISRPQPRMVAIDRRGAGYKLHSTSDRDRRKGGKPHGGSEVVSSPHPARSFVMQRASHSNDCAVEPFLLPLDAIACARDCSPVNKGHVMHIAKVFHHAQVGNRIVVLDDAGSRAWVRPFGKPGNFRGGLSVTVPIPDESVLLADLMRRQIETARHRLAFAVGGNQHASAGRIEAQSMEWAYQAIVADPSEAQLRGAMRAAVGRAPGPPAIVSPQHQPLAEARDADGFALSQLRAVKYRVPLIRNIVIGSHCSSFEDGSASAFRLDDPSGSL